MDELDPTGYRATPTQVAKLFLRTTPEGLHQRLVDLMARWPGRKRRFPVSSGVTTLERVGIVPRGGGGQPLEVAEISIEGVYRQAVPVGPNIETAQVVATYPVIFFEIVPKRLLDGRMEVLVKSTEYSYDKLALWLAAELREDDKNDALPSPNLSGDYPTAEVPKDDRVMFRPFEYRSYTGKTNVGLSADVMVERDGVIVAFRFSEDAPVSYRRISIQMPMFFEGRSKREHGIVLRPCEKVIAQVCRDHENSYREGAMRKSL